MATIFGSGGSSGGIFGRTTPQTDLLELAKQAGIEPPEDKKPLFSTLVDLLNAPSQMTENALTGGIGYESALNQAGIQNTKGQIDVNDILSFAAKIGLDPLNLVPVTGLGKLGLKGIAGSAKLAGKIKPIGKAGRALEELFVPFAKLKKVSPQLAEEIPALSTKIGARQQRTVKEVADLFKDLDPNIRKNIGKLVERKGAGEILTPQESEAVDRATRFIKERITNPEQEAGISPNILQDYFPRKADRQALESQLKFGGSRLSLGLGGAEKQRKFLTTAEAEAAGVRYKDPVEALAIRASKSEAARANAGFLQRLVGGEVKDGTGNPLVSVMDELGTAPGYSEFTIKELKGMQAPTEAVQEIEKYYKTFISDEATNDLLKFYDSALGIWKGSVTSIFPAFHIRNVVGNLTNMWLGGFTNPGKLATAAKIQRGAEVSVKGTKVSKELLEDLGIVGGGQFGTDIPKVLENVMGKPSIGSTAKKVVGAPFNAGRAVGSTIEDNARTAFFLDRLEKGDTVQKAVAQTHKYLFDYNALTPFERNVMRRIFPFYTWTRNNVPLQIESLITQPGKAAAITKTFTNLAPLTEEQESQLPSYLREGLTANIGQTSGGDQRIVGSFGLPIEDLGRLNRGGIGRTFEREILGASGPIGNTLGFLTGRDYYRGKNVEDLNYTYGKAAENYPKPLQNWLELKKTEDTNKDGKTFTNYSIDKKKFQLLQTVLPRILRALSDPESSLEFYRTTDVNLEESKNVKERQLEKQLEELLIDKGYLREFTRTFVPQNTTPNLFGK